MIHDGSKAKEKREAYFRYLNSRSAEEWQRYKNIRNRVKTKMGKIEEGYWETFT